MRAIVAGFLVMNLVGCALQRPQLEPYHPEHRDEVRFKRDVSECEYEAVKATASYTPDTTGMRTSFGAALSSAIDMRDRRMEVGLACLRARGYQFRPVGSSEAFR
jgi:hypothetical protein